MKPLAGQIIVITGTLTVPRLQFAELLCAAGAEVRPNLSAETTLLVMGDNPGSKADAAKARGIPTCSEMSIRARINHYPMPTHVQKLYGSSDDLVELAGTIKDEINVYDEPLYLRFDNGTHLKAAYAKDGCWRLETLERGTVRSIRKLVGLPDDPETEGSPQLHGDADAPSYSDVIVIETAEKLELVGHGSKPVKPPSPGLARAKRVIDFLGDRKGFDHWWHDIEQDDKNEILEGLAKLLEAKS